MTSADQRRGEGADPEDFHRRLEKYRSKRDFSQTDEPMGPPSVTAAESAEGLQRVETTPRFVVQRHRARRLHYDFRLEISGVLVSWSVPKGPTLDPSIKRLAVRTEDHPLEYADFEGVIPKGSYGAGDVVIWDEGFFTVDGPGDPATQLDRGEIHLDLQGKKLKGRFMLIHTGKGEDIGQWLMFHKQADGVEGWDAEDFPTSVRTGRTNEQVAKDPSSVVHGELPVKILDTDDDQLVELDGLGSEGVWSFAGRELKLTNLDKVMFPADKTGLAITKRDLIRHYASVSPLLIPHLSGRAVNLHRFPDGVANGGFWNKAVPRHAPDWLGRWDNPNARPGETVTYFVVDEPAALAWLANYGTVELHPWTSPTSEPTAPSFALFDIDAGSSTTWEQMLTLARLHRRALDHLGVMGFPNVSGKTGIQIRVPVTARTTFDETREWVETVSRAIGNTVPDLVSWEWKVEDRVGRARLDFTQNALNKTLVAPYCPRAVPGAPICTPIDWSELDDPNLRPDRWNIRSLRERLGTVGDVWSRLSSIRQVLPLVR